MARGRKSLEARDECHRPKYNNMVLGIANGSCTVSAELPSSPGKEGCSQQQDAWCPEKEEEQIMPKSLSQ